MSKDGEYMSLEEVADLLGVTYQLIYRLVRSGELPAIRLGKLYRVAREDLELYLQRNKRSAKSGGVCSVCGTFYRSQDSLGNICTEDGCGQPICFDCWTRLGINKCKNHS
jgi:excisionase family DNA binding protein